MKVLVVGAAGYLGRHVWRKLEERGHEVVAVDGLFWGQPKPPGLFEMKVETSEDMLALLGPEEVDSVIWLGAVAHDPEKKIPAATHKWWTQTAPGRCLYVCSGIRKVFVSTLSVFNKSTEGYPGYKRGAEVALFHHRNMNIVRFGTLYGPGVDVESHREHLLLNRMVYDALKNGFVRVANPAARRPVFPVDEAANDVILAALGDQPTAVGNSFTFCRTILEYGQVVSKMLKVPLTVEEGVDTRDYGWDDGMGQNGVEQWLPDELAPLVEWTREHMEEIRPRRQIFEVSK
jgi:nucleoside-diphosphate-sugar epimerase